MGQLINIILEVAVPLVQSRRAFFTERKYVAQTENPNSTDTRQLYDDAEKQSLSPTWGGNVDEYLEMVIQFGYVTMFVAAFPLAPVFAWINNLFELRVDACKLCYFYQKPESRYAANIGVWYPIMHGMSIMAVVVNCLLLFTRSRDIQDGDDIASVAMLDSLKTIGCSAKDVAANSCDYGLLYSTLLALVLLEHFVLVAKVALRAIIPNEPAFVRDDKFKEDYFKLKEDTEYEERQSRQQAHFSASKAAGKQTGLSDKLVAAGDDDRALD